MSYDDCSCDYTDTLSNLEECFKQTFEIILHANFYSDAVSLVADNEFVFSDRNLYSYLKFNPSGIDGLVDHIIEELNDENNYEYKKSIKKYKDALKVIVTRFNIDDSTELKIILSGFLKKETLELIATTTPNKITQEVLSETKNILEKLILNRNIHDSIIEDIISKANKKY